jgi:penicillin-insensitive murein DD-endopeptidase
MGNGLRAGFRWSSFAVFILAGSLVMERGARADIAPVQDRQGDQLGEWQEVTPAQHESPDDALTVARGMAGHPRARAAHTRRRHSGPRRHGSHPGHRAPVLTKVSAAASGKPSGKALSIGSPTDGKLDGGERVHTSRALRIAPGYSEHDVRWGLPALTQMIEHAAGQVAKKYPGSVMNLGHLSRQHGGELDHHASHESGRDADIGFYVNSGGKPYLADRFMAFGEDGKAAHNKAVSFDTARNWALVSELLTDPKARVTHIFVASPLRDKLLGYAKQAGAHPDIRERAAMVLAQPHGALPHDDHFHVRIGCPSRMEGCVEDPTPPKHRNQKVARSRHEDAPKGGHSSRPKREDKHAANANKPKPQAPAVKPEPEDPLDRLLGPRAQGLDSVVIPARASKVEPAEAPLEESDKKESTPEKPSVPFDDVDGPQAEHPEP